MWKTRLRWLLTGIMVAIGIAHFANPDPFVAIVPDALPSKLLLVYLSGAFEIALGLGLAWSRTRRLAAWGLIALYVAVFPANVNMAINDVPVQGHHVPAWGLWGRLPLQLVLIAWAYMYTRDHGAKSPASGGASGAPQ